jgi:pyruvate/2-oxoglutarate dehydrogenase complex dihydrolipoamide acyltransferase (E2) component
MATPLPYYVQTHSKWNDSSKASIRPPDRGPSCDAKNGAISRCHHALISRSLAPAAGQAKTRIEPLSTMRIRIAEHMLASRRTSAHVTTIHKVDMTKVPACATATKPISSP